MNELIEDYLRSGGVRYFRGHHDDEYFYLLHDHLLHDHLLHGRRPRLHVHLEVCGADRDAVEITITPDRYYPAALRDDLQQTVESWNDEAHGIGALVTGSSDPHLAGVAAGSRYRGGDSGEFGEFVDNCVAAATELFERIRIATGSAEALRNAG